jgi:hypothetical protein
MPTLSFLPMLSLVAQLRRRPAAPLRIWLRNTTHRFRPPRPAPHAAVVRRRQDAVLAAGAAGPHQVAQVLVEPRTGPQPTLVVGGFVPDATESVYLLRSGLLKQGSLYYFNYPRRGFSTDLFLAQLADLIEEVGRVHRRPPVIIAISFGAGLVIELLRRGAAPALGGLVLVSPVACVADLLDPAAPKATTLLGRVLKPYLDAAGPADDSLIERSRTIFLKMFEAGAQNKAALALLLARDETLRLRESVLTTINSITPAGAVERVRALREFPPLGEPRPLTTAPALVLYSEKESAVLVESSPTAREFQSRVRAWFPRGSCLVVGNTPDNPVQHASLIFHVENFQPPIAAFYRTLRASRQQAA